MKITIAPLAALAFLASPAFAGSLEDTHERVWAQAGKVPTVTYRPLSRHRCHVAASPSWNQKHQAADVQKIRACAADAEAKRNIATTTS